MNATKVAAPPRGPVTGDRQSWTTNVFKARESGIVLALIVLVVFTATQNSRFLSGQSIRDILLGTAILAVLAVGQAVVIITRNIDLSVGSVLGLSAFAVGSLMRDNPGLPVLVAVLAGIVVGAVCGLLNGVLVRFGQVCGAGRHPRHALRLPRGQLLLGRLASRSTPTSCRSPSWTSARRRSSGSRGWC